MKLSTSTALLIDQKKDALIVFYQGETALLPRGNVALKKLCDQLSASSAFKGEAGQTAVFPTGKSIASERLILAGLGEIRHFHNGLLEQAAAAATRAGLAAGASSFAMASGIALKQISEEEFHLLAGRGAIWGTYSFSSFKTDSKKLSAPSLTFAGPVKSRRAISNAAAQGNALLSTADLANLPGNEAPPSKIASWARTMAKANGLTCQVLGKAELTKKGCGAILSVARGSAQDAKMIIL